MPKSIPTKQQREHGLQALAAEFGQTGEYRGSKKLPQAHCPRKGCSGKIVRATRAEVPEHLREDWNRDIYRCPKCRTTMHHTPIRASA